MRQLYFILVFLLFMPIISFSQTSIGGVITYFFNDYQGNKADIGSKVFILDSLNSPNEKFGIVDTFLHVKLYRALIELNRNTLSTNEFLISKYKGKKQYAKEYEILNSQILELNKSLDRYNQILIDYNAETDEKFKILDTKTSSLLKSLNDKNCLITTVDGNGNYSLNIKSGTYYVYIISKNRRSINSTEISGDIYFTKVTVKEGIRKEVSHNFQL